MTTPYDTEPQSQPEVQQPQPQAFPTSAPSATTTPKRPWYKRTWVIAVAALLVGTAIGSSGGADPTTTTEYQAVAAERDQAQDDVAAAQADLEAAQGDLEAAEAEVESIAGDLPAREDAVAEAEAAAAKAGKDLANGGSSDSPGRVAPGHCC